MKIETRTKIQCFIISDAPELDPVTVVLESQAPGTGKVLVECFGEGWATYFGGIGDNTIRQFLSKLDARYLSNRLISRTFHNPARREEQYILRISQAIIDACKMLEV